MKKKAVPIETLVEVQEEARIGLIEWLDEIKAFNPELNHEAVETKMLLFGTGGYALTNEEAIAARRALARLIRRKVNKLHHAGNKINMFFPLEPTR